MDVQPYSPPASVSGGMGINNGGFQFPAGVNPVMGTGVMNDPIKAEMKSTPTGSPGNYNYGNAGNPTPSMGPNNPWMPTQNPGTDPAIGAGQNPNAFSGTLGSGLAGWLNSFLNSEGGYNSALTQQNVNATTQAMQHNIGEGWQNIETNLGATGISPNSSVAALTEGDYFSNAITQENAITAQDYFSMWQSSMSNETNILGDLINPSAQHQQNTSFMSRFGQTLGDIGSLGLSYSDSTDQNGGQSTSIGL